MTRPFVFDDLLRVDVRALVRVAGSLAEHRGVLTWRQGGTCAYEWQPDRGTLALSWFVRGKALAVAVALSTTAPNFGGLRWWALCPQCGRRCAVLALSRAADRVGCRVCLRLGYRSQRVTAVSRAVSACLRLRRRHGGPSNMFERWPDKPARMHWSRWARIKRREAGYLAVTDGHLRALGCAPMSSVVAGPVAAVASAR